MMFNLFKKSKPNPLMVNSLIGPDTTIDGNISFNGGLRVEGLIKGNVKGSENSMIVLVKGARITGSIEVTHAIIDGRVEDGEIICETIEIQPNARIECDITYKDITIMEEAIINGRLTNQKPSIPEIKDTKIQQDALGSYN